MACEEIVDEFNDLRSDIVLLFDLKNALNSAEYELQTTLHRLKHENGPINAGGVSAPPLSSGSNSSAETSRTVKNFHSKLIEIFFSFLAFRFLIISTNYSNG